MYMYIVYVANSRKKQKFKHYLLQEIARVGIGYDFI